MPSPTSRHHLDVATGLLEGLGERRQGRHAAAVPADEQHGAACVLRDRLDVVERGAGSQARGQQHDHGQQGERTEHHAAAGRGEGGEEHLSSVQGRVPMWPRVVDASHGLCALGGVHNPALHAG